MRTRQYSTLFNVFPFLRALLRFTLDHNQQDLYVYTMDEQDAIIRNLKDELEVNGSHESYESF
jgi:hypothetical protein